MKKHTQLKLYTENDPDFMVHSRFNDIVFPESDTVISTCQNYLCITSIDIKPHPRDGSYLTGQFEMALPYLKWFLAVKARFALSPDQGGYPPGEMSDIIQLDADNQVFVFRGPHFGNRGLMRFALENRKRASYINPRSEQEIDLYDLYFEECGLLETFFDIQKNYEDGKL
ncbi:MAG: hypothetical protein P8X74_22245 [Reinekea sp.]